MVYAVVFHSFTKSTIFRPAWVSNGKPPSFSPLARLYSRPIGHSARCSCWGDGVCCLLDLSSIPAVTALKLCFVDGITRTTAQAKREKMRDETFFKRRKQKLYLTKVRKLIDISRRQSEGSSFNSYYSKIGERATPFPGCRLLTLILPLVLSAQQGSIEYHFKIIWYDSARDWTHDLAHRKRAFYY